MEFTAAFPYCVVPPDLLPVDLSHSERRHNHDSESWGGATYLPYLLTTARGMGCDVAVAMAAYCECHQAGGADAAVRCTQCSAVQCSAVRPVSQSPLQGSMWLSTC
jgi:hypothetical protein